ncbi:hypothetical protein HaLaN_18478 [Haematococcus lacustris]|uniref:Uncharacterized protein n=1 Tax=Haematococcus lacustris TaxID=44745 RepID=A0A699ZJH5_HAELA|nr:hypothetical protein HaLaN_18478 [Haematococcus lacustris]
MQPIYTIIGCNVCGVCCNVIMRVICKTGIAIGVIRCGQPHVTPDVSQSQTVAASRGCEETRIRVWQRCIAIMVHEEPTELGLPLRHVAPTNTT